MFFVNNTIRLPGNPHGQGCRTVSFIQEIRSRSFFVILKFACDICMQIKPYESISANQHGIWSTKLYLRPRVISKALQIRNLESASHLVVKMSHFVTHLKLRILLLLDQFKSFFPEILACEADGHSRFGHQSSICQQHSCQTARASFYRLRRVFWCGEFRVRGVVWWGDPGSRGGDPGTMGGTQGVGGDPGSRGGPGK